MTAREGFDHAGRFPLAMLWVPMRQGNRDYAMVQQLGAQVQIDKKNEMYVIVSAVSFIPPDMPCPALRENGLCSIHETKPRRCKTMPFTPYREERFQSELLKPRETWLCDISASAPIVYQDRQLLDRTDFDAERAGLLDEVPQMRRYVEYMLKYNPDIRNNLVKSSLSPKAGEVVTSLSSFLTATRQTNKAQIARQQIEVLQQYLEHTAGKSAYKTHHDYYTRSLAEMQFLASRPD